MTQGLISSYNLGDFQPRGERKHKRPTPADFGFDVTICIAAMTHLQNCIVTVSDMMLSYGDIVPATDIGVHKNLKLGKAWGILFAGDDIAPALPIVDRASVALKPHSDESLATMIATLCNAYQQERRQQIQDRILSALGFTFKEFNEKGYERLGPTEFSKTLKQVRDFNLGIEFLVYGSDTLGRHIFSVDEPGAATDRDLVGYWAIGSGHYMALGALAGRPIKALSVPELIYRLCAAKFAAGTATGVGKATMISVLNSRAEEAFFSAPLVNELKDIWERESKAILPNDVYDAIAKTMKADGITL